MLAAHGVTGMQNMLLEQCARFLKIFVFDGAQDLTMLDGRPPQAIAAPGSPRVSLYVELNALDCTDDGGGFRVAVQGTVKFPILEDPMGTVILDLVGFVANPAQPLNALLVKPLSLLAQ